MKKLTMILVIVLSSVVILSSQVIAEDASPIEWVIVDGCTDDVFPKQTCASSNDTLISRHNPVSKAIFTISSGEEGESTFKSAFGEGDDALTVTITKIWMDITE